MSARPTGRPREVVYPYLKTPPIKVNEKTMRQAKKKAARRKTTITQVIRQALERFAWEEVA